MRIEELVDTLKKEYYKAKILQASLDSAIVFFVLYLVSVLFGVSELAGYRFLYFAAGFSLVFFVSDSFYRSRNYEIELYEEENPELDEMLRTARDNLDDNSIVSKALFDEVVERTRSISPSTVISEKAILYKTLLILFLSFATVITGMVDFSVTDKGGEIIDQVTNPGGSENQTDDVNFENLETGDPEDILGEPQDIDPSDHEFDINYDVQDGGIYRESRAYESDGNFVSMFDTGSNLEERELARRYMVRIREIQSQ